MKKINLLCILMLLIPAVEAAANLEVSAFACNPNEVVANNQFSCTATVQNTGDATGTLNTATLYPDATNWLENANYPETVNTNINSGASAEVTFNGLRGKKSGNNGFSKIMLDDVTDTYAADNGVKVNVIDVVGTVTASASSAAASATVTVTSQATAGGNVDITLTLSLSGGCSIGSQPAAAAANEMTNGQTTSHTWTVTMGSTTCSYSVAAKAASNPTGAAIKTDTTSGTVTCSSGCTSSDSTSTSSSSGGGGGGGAASNATANKTAAAVQCADGIDNDNDGLIDLKDPGCESVEDALERDAIVCKQSWDCSDWSDCMNNKRTRICVDSNNCLSKKAAGTVDKVLEVPKPEETLECTAAGAPSIEKIVKDYGIWILVFVIIAAVLGYLYYHGHHHVRKAKKKAEKFFYEYKK